MTYLVYVCSKTTHYNRQVITLHTVPYSLVVATGAGTGTGTVILYIMDMYVAMVMG
jgi:hypothetical protein